MPPKTYQEVAVDRLYAASEMLDRLFSANVGDQASHGRIRDSAPGYIKGIGDGLARFKEGPLAGEFAGPSSSFRSFVAVWDKGAAMPACYEVYREYHTLLTNCRTAVYELMAANRGGGGSGEGGGDPDKPSRRDVELLSGLVEKSRALLETYQAAVSHHDSGHANTIQEMVTAINERLGQSVATETATAMKVSREHWQDFMLMHRRGIGQMGLEYLKTFVADLQRADEIVVKAAA